VTKYVIVVLPAS